MLSLVIFAFVSGNKRKSDEELDGSENAPKRVSTPSVSCVPFHSVQAREQIESELYAKKKSFKEMKYFAGAARIARSKGLVERRHFGEVSVRMTTEFVRELIHLFSYLSCCISNCSSVLILFNSLR